MAWIPDNRTRALHESVSGMTVATFVTVSDTVTEACAGVLSGNGRGWVSLTVTVYSVRTVITDRHRHAMQPDTPLTIYQRRIAAGELRADRAQLVAVRQLHKLHRALCAQQSGWLARLRARRWQHRRGVYLWGGVGTGKTLLMDIFFRALPDNFARRMHFHRFMLWVHSEKNRIQSKQDPLAIIAAQLAAQHQVLCLDEFSVTDITDAMMLSGLLHNLFAHNVALITTSNIHPDELYRDGLQRARFLPAIEMLTARTRILQVDGGTDYRMAHLESDALYHIPHDARAAAALRRRYVALECDGDINDAPKTLTLAGRSVAVVATGRGTVWFDFDALCRGNRSKRDYVELSKRFHTVILQDIPQLTADDDDAARRLIELVDELYDRGVNLVVSAADAAAELYVGTRLRHPFERTASRLREMGSRAYLARPHLL